MSFLQSRTRSAREGLGRPALRKDDARLLVGDGCYSDDVNLAGQVYACFVRSPHAHARIRRVETDAALATPGVIAVLTGEDAAADEIKPITHSPMPGNPHEDMIRTATWRSSRRIRRSPPTARASWARSWRWSSPTRPRRRATAPNAGSSTGRPCPQ